MRIILGVGRRRIVYVDAKIIGMHDKQLPKKAFVGFIVEGTENHRDATGVEATETDEAEEQAILFAMTSLKEHFQRFTVICDHESAVTKVNWKGNDRKKGKNDWVLPKIWAEMDENKSIRIRPLKSNPAHAYLNKWLKDSGIEV
jgi:ribonuclease HI